MPTNRTSGRHRAASAESVALRRRQIGAGALVALVAASSLTGLIHSLGSPATATSVRTGSSASAMPGRQPSQSGAASAPGTAANPSAGAGAAASATSSPTGSASATPGTVASSSAPVVQKGSGTFTPVALSGTPASSGRVVTVGLDVENGIGADNPAIAKQISGILLDPRGWQGVDHVSFHFLSQAQLDKGDKPAVMITIASPDTVNKLCAPLNTEGELSCGNAGRAVLNYLRWADGVSYYGSDLNGYRTYLVSHEVGHIIGHGHQYCSATGAYAPVMEQQTKGLQGCKPWPWPQRP